MNKKRSFAAIDLGSNTIRLVCAHPQVYPSHSLKVVSRKLQVVRLGEGFVSDGRLIASAMDRAIKALKELASVASEYDPEQIHLVATGVVRDALNQKEFLDMVSQELGINVRVLKGEEEAELTLLGVRSTLPDISAPMVVCDIGGGSTEFAVLEAEDGKPRFFSIPLGAIRLKERFSIPAPMEKDLEPEINTFISKNLDDVSFGPEIAPNFNDSCFSKLAWGFASKKVGTLVATAGTPTTLASIDQGLDVYDPLKVHGYRFRFSRIRQIYDRLAVLSLDERRGIAGLEPGREDIIITGTAILLHVMQKLEIEHLTVSEGGLLEGILAQTYCKLSGIFPKIFI